ncbi:hypothetical protein EDC96DRAFT_604148 [Choanephora cucurbitarum]|uniref:Uncharacterized protein n=1 Tax=Choanephora cucurbitarum TaxID=101091 RepID=A0A1C7NQW5_9FUNG|nr:hypothetical protein EDC96DRAFT_604148 [Choanephora cucurbitarum]OBZ91535.1 hypothetical protein A0J61_00426 [Choanephora cucurbitarum]
MDLSWCIICDNRVDDVLNESSLYCSESCQLKDQMKSITNQLAINQQQQQQQQQQKKLMLSSKPIASLRNKRPAAPSASYPWVPLYRRRRGVVVSKRCQPVVASSFTTANALFSSNKSTLA